MEISGLAIAFADHFASGSDWFIKFFAIYIIELAELPRHIVNYDQILRNLDRYYTISLHFYSLRLSRMFIHI